MSERIFRNLDEVLDLGEKGIMFNRGHVRLLKERIPELIQPQDLFYLTEVDEESTGQDFTPETSSTPLAQKRVKELMQFCQENQTAIIPLTGMIIEELQQYKVGENLYDIERLMDQRRFTEAVGLIQEILTEVKLMNFQKKYIAQFMTGLTVLLDRQVVTDPDQVQGIQDNLQKIQRELDRIDQEVKHKIVAVALLKRAQRSLGS